jgi:two-component system, chemotaxis family, chemotaxis protein CheY
MQILVVDDSPLMRRYIARTLEMTGIELCIHEAGNGREAIGKASEIRPALIITDLNMPEMNGDELVARIAADPQLCTTPILVISADHSAGRSDELIHVGAVAYLTKPVTPQVLRDRLLQIMGANV